MDDCFIRILNYLKSRKKNTFFLEDILSRFTIAESPKHNLRPSMPLSLVLRLRSRNEAVNDALLHKGYRSIFLRRFRDFDG